MTFLCSSLVLFFGLVAYFLVQTSFFTPETVIKVIEAPNPLKQPETADEEVIRLYSEVRALVPDVHEWNQKTEIITQSDQIQVTKAKNQKCTSIATIGSWHNWYEQAFTRFHYLTMEWVSDIWDQKYPVTYPPWLPHDQQFYKGDWKPKNCELHDFQKPELLNCFKKSNGKTKTISIIGDSVGRQIWRSLNQVFEDRVPCCLKDRPFYSKIKSEIPSSEHPEITLHYFFSQSFSQLPKIDGYECVFSWDDMMNYKYVKKHEQNLIQVGFRINSTDFSQKKVFKKCPKSVQKVFKKYSKKVRIVSKRCKKWQNTDI